MSHLWMGTNYKIYMLTPFTLLIGSLIAMMIMFNSVLAEETGQVLSLLIFHVVGLSTAILFGFFVKEKSDSQRVPIYLYSAGILGVIVVFINNYCFAALGASVTMAIVIMGQSIGSVLTDTIGLLRRPKHLFDIHKMFGFTVILIGIITMVDEWEFQLFYLISAFLTGILVLVTMIFNSQIAICRGIFYATRTNFLTGLATVALICIVTGYEFEPLSTSLDGVHPIHWFGGGVTGVMVVAGIGYVVPKIPTLYSTILIFLGQILTSLVIDYFLTNFFSLQILIGSTIVFLGFVMNLWVDTNHSSREKPDTTGLSVI